jgi:hypothetical protein
VQSLLDSLADGNGDGILDDNEQRIMLDGLTCIARDEMEKSTTILRRLSISRRMELWTGTTCR